MLILSVVDSLLMFADNLYMEGDPYRAILEYKRVLYTLRTEGRDTGKLYSRVLSKVVETYISLGDPAGGMRAMEYWGVRNDPNYRKILGTLLFVSGEYGKARRLWEGDDTLEAVAGAMLGDREAYRILGKPRGLKSPILAATLSAVVPGLGKIYAGRLYDGLYSLAINASLSLGLYFAVKDGSRVRTAVYGVALTYFWTGNVYGSYVTVKKMNESITLEYVSRWLPLF